MNFDMKTAIIYHPKYVEHNLGEGHPERPERLRKTMELLRKNVLGDVLLIEPKAASEKDLLRVHTQRYVEYVRDASREGGMIDMDTPVPRGTYEIALLSAGGAILAGEIVMKNEAPNTFAVLRPPGHHSGRDFGGGFCYFNNIAIMIEYLKEKHSIRRAMILDWDVHHGNGTQDIYYEDNSVLYFSTHQSPLYPGTGRMSELGSGAGLGYNINFPLSPGSTGADFLYILKEMFVPLAEEFRPDFIAVSAGYDAYFIDPLASLGFTIQTYADATKIVKKTAEKVCNGRLAVLWEGGYHLDAISYGSLATAAVLAGKDGEAVKEINAPPTQSVSVQPRVAEFRKVLGKYWTSMK